MRTSKRNNNKMESKTQTQHNRKKATRIRVSERDWEKERKRAERKVKRARPTKLAKEASSTAVMADETSLPATTQQQQFLATASTVRDREEKSPLLKNKRGKRGREKEEHNIRSSRRVAQCFCLLLTPSLGAVQRHPLSLSTSPTLFDEWEWRDCDRQCWRERVQEWGVEESLLGVLLLSYLMSF